MRRSLAALIAALSACAGPTRTDPSFRVRPEVRPSAPIRLPESAAVAASGPACGEREADRARSALGALARELDRSGFVLVEGNDPPPALLLDLKLVLDDCERGLFGDVALTLTSSAGKRMEQVALEDVWFSNVAGLANDLADRIARSSTIADFATRRGAK